MLPKVYATSTPDEPPSEIPRLPPIVPRKTTSLPFAISWLLLFLLHGVNVAYYTVAAKAYLAIRQTFLALQLGNYSISIAPSEYTSVSKVHLIVAILHVFIMVAMIGGSMQAKRWVFWPSVPRWMLVLHKQLWKRIQRVMNKPRNRVMKDEHNSIDERSSRMSTLSSFVFSRDGVFGVDCIYFDHLLLVRELIETNLQLIQLYRMTHLLPRLWLIRFYVVLLIANCWSTPFLHRLYRDRHVARRLSSLLCDAILDMLSSIGVTFVIYATYVPQYTDPVVGFPLEKWYDEVWFTNMQQEFQMMMVVSWADMASRLVFAVGVIQSMQSIKDLLTPIESRKNTEIIKVSTVNRVEASKDKPIPSKTPVQPSSPWIKTKLSLVVHIMLEKVGPGFFAMLGCAILVVHLIAETLPRSTVLPCQLPIHPWFVSKPACSLVELDCHQLKISGSQESLIDAWHAFDSGSTVRLFVRHCPQLEVPATLQQFHQLTSIKLYNCTIVSWDDTAALTATTHPNMIGLSFLRTAFPGGTLPPGLCAPNFPRQLTNVLTSITNLQTLPNNLHESWPPGMTVTFEDSQMQVVPTALTQLMVKFVSLSGSPIATVPAELFENPYLCCVMLIGMPLRELPRIVPNRSPNLFLLHVANTKISTFWSWLDSLLSFEAWLPESYIAAHGSPFCTQRDEIVAGNRTNFTIADSDKPFAASVMDVSTPAKLGFSIAAVSCQPKSNYFPMHIQDDLTAIR